MLNRIILITAFTLAILLFLPKNVTLSDTKYAGDDSIKSLQSDTQFTLFQWSPSGNTFAIYYSEIGFCFYDGNTFEPREIEIDLSKSTNPVAMAFANDHSLTTGHQDGTIQVWDLRTGHQINVLEAHEGGVRTIDISPDGLLMASGTLDEDLVRIWDYETNELSDEIHFTSRGVVNVLFSSDSQLLAYSGLEPVIVGWSIEENHGNIYRMPQPLQFGDWIGQSVFTADGEFLIAVTSRGVFAWSVETRMLIELNVPPFEIYHAVFGNEDGSIIALTTDDAVIIYNVIVENDQVELLRRTAFPNGEGSVPVALNPSGTALAYGSQELHLWHIETHEEIDYDQCQE